MLHVNLRIQQPHSCSNLWNLYRARGHNCWSNNTCLIHGVPEHSLNSLWIRFKTKIPVKFHNCKRKKSETSEAYLSKKFFKTNTEEIFYRSETLVSSWYLYYLQTVKYFRCPFGEGFVSVSR